MKKVFILFTLLPLLQASFGQESPLIALKEAISTAKEDTTKLNLLNDLSDKYLFKDPDSTIKYAQIGVRLARQLNNQEMEGSLLWHLAFGLSNIGDYTNALDYWYQCIAVRSRLKDTYGLDTTYLALANTYRDQGDYFNAQKNIDAARHLAIPNDPFDNLWCDRIQAIILAETNHPDSALFYLNRAIPLLRTRPWSYQFYVYAEIYASLGQDSLAISNYRKAISMAIQDNSHKNLIDYYNGLSQLYWTERKADSAIKYSNLVLEANQGRYHRIGALRSSSLLAEIYDAQKKQDSVLKYLKLSSALRDSLFSQQKTRAAQSFAFNQELRQQEMMQRKQEQDNKLKTYGLISVASTILIIALLLYRNNRQKQRAYTVLQDQKSKTDVLRDKAESTLQNLQIANQRLASQKRELEIEASLERIRAASFSMQTSDGLHRVIQLILKELIFLQFKVDSAHFIVDLDEPTLNFWGATPDEAYPDKISVPHGSSRISRTYQDALSKHLDFMTDQYSFEEKNDMWESFFETLPQSNEKRRQIVMSSPGYARSVAFTKNIALMILNYEGTPFTEEENLILRRFTTVFDQTYSRFLDLQKAEQQASEAIVEAALERIRYQAMAMQNSEDVVSASASMFTEMERLGIENLRCGILVLDESRTMEVWSVTNMPGEKKVTASGTLSVDATLMWKRLYEGWQRKEEFFFYPLLGKEREDYYATLANSPGYLSGTIPAQPDQYFHAFYFKEGCVWAFSTRPYSDADKEVLKKFTAVFSLTFRRHQDLKKAEHQAREATIEAALERVRYGAMAMQKSQDVSAATVTMFTEMQNLGVENLRCGIALFNDSEKMEVWSVTNLADGKKVLASGFLNIATAPLWKRLYKSWMERDEFMYYPLKGREREEYYRNLANSPGYLTGTIPDQPDQYFHSSNFRKGEGCVWTFSEHPYSNAEKEVLKKFADVFALTFRRHLDLKNAEHQAREAIIEAALERVRSQTMAMHKTEDLAETVTVIFQQINKLDLGILRCGIGIIDDQKIGGWITSHSDGNSTVHITFDIPVDMHPLNFRSYEAWQRHEDFDYLLKGEDLKAYYDRLAKLGFKIPSFQSKMSEAPLDEQYYFAASFRDGAIYCFSAQPISPDTKAVLKRFATAVSLTYARFSDLQNAELRAREATIEAALERVRYRAMAMQNGNDVSEVTSVMFSELEKLGVKTLRCGIVIIHESRTMDIWTATSQKDGKVAKIIGEVDMTIHPLLQGLFDAGQQKKEMYTYRLVGEEIARYYRILSTLPNFPLPPQDQEMPEQTCSVYYFEEGGLYTFTNNPNPEDVDSIMKKFTTVFSLTYRRYKDLKLAEDQAREATIEAALERVRGKAMAMRDTNDLSVTATLLFNELKKIDTRIFRCSVSIVTKQDRIANIYSTMTDSGNETFKSIGSFECTGHPIIERIYDTWLAGQDYFPVLEGEELATYYEFLKSHLPWPVPVERAPGEAHYGSFIYFPEGNLCTWSVNPFTTDEVNIQKRFGTVISLTFRRYFELQISESSAKEAVKQASLDRIRAEIASMRTTHDLENITPLIWHELKTLGLPFVRCGVFIMDDTEQLVHAYLSTPEGKAIAAFHLPYGTPGTIGQILVHWQDKKTYIAQWDDSDFIQMADILLQQGAISKREEYLNTLPRESFYLHCLPFLQGMLYVANTEHLEEDQIQLTQSIADAFSTAYARYEDFTRLETAKLQVEDTLADLKQAQQQLIQSEKMASLGELTAGIAHEIQNPLNFVNNFSEVNRELVEELQSELKSGNIKEAIAISSNIKENEDKINHHGKRADGIVKGMLQHSRSGSGQKEPTDMNALADEYLRLSYHGFRAKDKSFNVRIDSSLDPNLPRINILSQDIGRVLLNLFTNAFYSVINKRKHLGDSYQPEVYLKTANRKSFVEISVRDNGMGISPDIMDKIFNPFFTTKPGAEGTGLGLSLSYEIITKAHGGTIEVETREGEYAEFIVRLPMEPKQQLIAEKL